MGVLSLAVTVFYDCMLLPSMLVERAPVSEMTAAELGERVRAGDVRLVYFHNNSGFVQRLRSTRQGFAELPLDSSSRDVAPQPVPLSA